MKQRIKWLLVGFGFTALLQFLISVGFTGLAFSAARSEVAAEQGSISLFVFGFTLGAFLVGGFVLGWMSERLRILDSILVAVLTLVVTAVIFAAMSSEAARAQFVIGNWLSETAIRANADGTPSAVTQLAFSLRSGLFVLLAIAASVIGAYWGSHVKVPQEGFIDRAALLVGLVGAVVGPFIMVVIAGGEPGAASRSGLPWYVLATIAGVLIAIVGVGYVMFTRESHYEDEISISPEHHREPNGHALSHGA
jgi:hypothetical protein